MDDALLSVITRRLASDDPGDDVGLLVLAACDGDESLLGALSGGFAPLDVQPASEDSLVSVEPSGAYLKSLLVEGFRGIGDERTLTLTPGPGLTLVVGRNGSGKSSFVEALEVLLTDESKRWTSRREKAWSQGWRNLHHPEPTRVVGEFAVDGVKEPTTISKEWKSGDEVGDASASVQTKGQRRASFSALGWAEALSAYRPILSYNELGSILDEGPSKLYDALVAILGLDELNLAVTRLSSMKGDLKKLIDNAKSQAHPLVSELEDLDDERAVACAKAMSAPRWNLDLIADLATGAAGSEITTDVDLLREFANLAGPDPEVVAAVVANAIEAADLLEEVRGTVSESADRTASLLESALEHHQHSGDESCPVCGGRTLDADWADATSIAIERLRREARAARRAHDAVREATLRLQSVIVIPAVPLPEATRLGLPAEGTRTAWESLLDISTNDLQAAAVLVEERATRLVAELAVLRAAAAQQLSERENLWAPLAERVLIWLQIARQSQAVAAHRSTVEAAERWLKSAIDEIRNERLAPFLATRSAEIWSQLSQQSNVTLGPMQLLGAGPRRRVSLDVTVDGVESVALAVMSQGELHALALAIFLPRVTLPQSPFRFLIIDDPVQAMDPAKVEGFARVLETTARFRQVVVFTHDDRLPQAIRYLGIDATVIEVTRRTGSQVELNISGDPAEVQLDDPRAVALSKELPDDVRIRVVPGYCRLALEAVLNDVIRRKLLDSGVPHAKVEEEIAAVTTLTMRAALALFGDANRGSEVLSRLGAYGRWAQDAYQAANRGAHEGYAGDLSALVRETSRLVDKLRVAA